MSMPYPIYRTGRKLGKTIYRQVGAEQSYEDVFLGFGETVEIAEAIVAALNYKAVRVKCMPHDPEPEEGNVCARCGMP